MNIIQKKDLSYDLIDNTSMLVETIKNSSLKNEVGEIFIKNVLRLSSFRKSYDIDYIIKNFFDGKSLNFSNSMGEDLIGLESNNCKIYCLNFEFGLNFLVDKNIKITNENLKNYENIINTYENFFTKPEETRSFLLKEKISKDITLKETKYKI